MYKILALDGGGIRGIISAVVLKYIEKQSGKHIAEMFDLVAGTSAGGLIASMLTVADSTGNVKYSAEDVTDLFVNNGGKIFGKRRFCIIGPLGEERYDHMPLEGILNGYFDDARLSECIKPIIVPAYEIESRESWFFKTAKAKTCPDYDYFLKDVCRATSAAPTYFEPSETRSMANSTYYFIDGGVFAVSPAMCAYAEALCLDEKEILVVSIGTGFAHDEPIRYNQAVKWGLIQWVDKVVSTMLDGSADVVDYQLQSLLGKESYFRFNVGLGEGRRKASDDLDDASRSNISKLERRAEQLIADKKDDIHSAIDQLLK